MTAEPSRPVLDRRDDGRGAVPHDDGAALSTVENGEAVGLPSVGGLVRGLAFTLAQARPVRREATRLARDCARIARGTDEHLPSPRDKRFADPAWSLNPVYRRLSQAYLAAGDAASRLVDDLEAQGRDWHDVERARFAVNAVTSALAPTNALLGNPAALKRAFDTGGASVLRGLGHLADDVRHNGAMPSQTDRSAFEVGRDLAVTPGAVIARDEVAELIQYTPSTPTVRSRPVLVIPPPIGRYYFLDLRPGRSFVEYALSQGLQVFMVSWRNPQAEQADWGMDTYARRILDALETVREVSGCRRRQHDRLLRRRHPHDDTAQPPRADRPAAGAQRVLRRHPARLRQRGRRSGRSPRRGCWSSLVATADGGGSSPRGRWERSSPGCDPTTWSSTMWSTTG